ncbi:hypothetical protein CE91St45_13370 [Oscillospiraceae bacterium]|nr:hypothetical protein CE91St45_13370 [Oscillospiraceae bacterium]
MVHLLYRHGHARFGGNQKGRTSKVKLLTEHPFTKSFGLSSQAQTWIRDKEYVMTLKQPWTAADAGDGEARSIEEGSDANAGVQHGSDSPGYLESLSRAL